MVTHLKAMQQQLRDVYWGMALAVLLNRTFVLPKVCCVYWVGDCMCGAR